jgi:branched-chain amino acid transport system ATP-binding protein
MTGMLSVVSNNASAASRGQSILACRNVTARYGRIGVCHGVDLAVSAGEIVAVLGPNGAGKSSLLGSIAGLVQGDGEVTVGGQAIGHMPAFLRAKHGLAFVPEIRGNI